MTDGQTDGHLQLKGMNWAPVKQAEKVKVAGEGGHEGRMIDS